MKLFGIVIRRSFVSEKEPKWFHDCHRNNGFQIGFFGWVIYYNKGK